MNTTAYEYVLCETFQCEKKELEKMFYQFNEFDISSAVQAVEENHEELILDNIYKELFNNGFWVCIEYNNFDDVPDIGTKIKYTYADNCITILKETYKDYREEVDALVEFMGADLDVVDTM